MKKILIAVIILLFTLPAYGQVELARMSPAMVGGGVTVAESHQHTIYFTGNTATFNSITQEGNTIINTGVMDSHLDESNPTYNYGTCHNINYGGTTTVVRPIWYFPVSENIGAGATIISVELWFYGYSGNWALDGAGITLNRVLDAHMFTEGAGVCSDNYNDVSWNNYTTGSTWTTAGTVYSATVLGTYSQSSANHCYEQWCQITETATNLSDFAQNVVSGTWTNYGFVGVRDTSNESVNSVLTKEESTSLGPYLKVIYSH